MAKITDPDLLADEASYTGTTEVYIDTSSRYIRLTQVGDLSTDGVTLKCLYSFLKEEWKNDPNTKNLAGFDFPMVPITDEAFEFVDGWDFYDAAARYLIRDAGWTVKNTSGNVTQEWAGIIGLGTIEADDQLYFEQGAGATNVQLTGQVNQAVQTIDDPNGDGSYVDGFDYRAAFTLFAREYSQIYGQASLTDIGVTALAPQAYRFPISTATDLKIEDTDGNVSTISPYTEIVIRYFDQAFTIDVDTPGTGRNYGIVVDVGTHSGVDGSMSASGSVLTTTEGGIPTDATYTGGTLIIHEGTNKGSYTISGTPTATTVTITTTFSATDSNVSFTIQRASPVVATAEEIYTKVQYQLRQNSDIDATDQSVIGKTADELMEFVGDTLHCGRKNPTNPNGGGYGVIILGFAASDTNRLKFWDNVGTERAYPFVAAITFNFGTNLQNDAGAYWWAWFTYTHRVTGTDLAITSASGQTATLTSSTTNLTEIASGEQFLVSGFATSGNNGYYEATGAGGATSVAVKKANVNDPDFTNESAGATVNLDMNPFGSTSAIIIQDDVAADMKGAVGGSPSAQKGFNYDSNVQGGRTASVAAQVTAVAIGQSTSQHVKATGVIAQSVTNSISLVSALERNYENP